MYLISTRPHKLVIFYIFTVYKERLCKGQFSVQSLSLCLDFC